MEYFVSLSGRDDNPGTKDRPFATIARGVSELGPGDVLNLRHGVYVEAVDIAGKHGTADAPIVIRSYPGETAYIDGTLREFRRPSDVYWVPGQDLDPDAREDEYVSAATYEAGSVNRGAFLDRNPYTRLVTYSNINDLRADNETFEQIFDPGDPRDGPVVVDEDGAPMGYSYPWVYMGPGAWFNPASQRIHVRLQHTSNGVAGIADYAGETDPRRVKLALAPKDLTTLRVRGSSHLRLEHLTVRFGGEYTVQLTSVQDLVLDHVRIRASTFGLRMGGPAEAPMRNVIFKDCEFDGGVPTWYFRSDRKAQYYYLDGEVIVLNLLGKNTSAALLYGNPNDTAIEIHHCEFLRGHDVYLFGRDVDFHHNWVHNLNDEGLWLDAGDPPPVERSVTHLHENVITKTLSALGFAGQNETILWHTYRNLIDLRLPTAGFRPRNATDRNVWRYGHLYKSDPPDGPHDLFQNTFLVYDQDSQASFMHYRETTGPHPRRSLNNMFIAVNPDDQADRAVTFVPSPSFPGPTDGNLYHRVGVGQKPGFRYLAYTFDGEDFRAGSFAELKELQGSELFEQSRTQYPPGYEADSIEADPQLRRIRSDGRPRDDDDLRLTSGSPAIAAGVPLPPLLAALDPYAPPEGRPDIGCFPLDAEPLRVGVDGRHSFPATDDRAG